MYRCSNARTSRSLRSFATYHCPRPGNPFRASFIPFFFFAFAAGCPSRQSARVRASFGHHYWDELSAIHSCGLVAPSVVAAARIGANAVTQPVQFSRDVICVSLLWRCLATHSEVIRRSTPRRARSHLICFTTNRDRIADCRICHQEQTSNILARFLVLRRRHDTELDCCGPYATVLHTKFPILFCGSFSEKYDILVRMILTKSDVQIV